jgi:hypothetical protein
LKKIILLVTLVLCGIFLTWIEINAIKVAQEVEMREVVTFNRNIKSGSRLSLNDLSMTEIPTQLFNSSYFEEPMALVDQVLKIDVTKDGIVSIGMLMKNAYYTPDDGNAITTLKLSPEEMMCGIIENGESVTVMSVDEQLQLIKLGDVSVKGVLSQSLETVDATDTIPCYLVVEGPINVVERIIKSRNNRRMEVIRKSPE